MTNLAIDRFMQSPSPDIEAEATRVLAELRPSTERRSGDDAFMNGWLSASIAQYLEAPWWSRRARRRLAVDLLVAKRYLRR